MLRNTRRNKPNNNFLLVLNYLVLFITLCPSSILGLGFIRYKEPAVTQ